MPTLLRMQAKRLSFVNNILFLHSRIRSPTPHRLIPSELFFQVPPPPPTSLSLIILTSDIDIRYIAPVTEPTEILQGTLDLLVLRTLQTGPLHGVGVADRIQQVTRGVFVIGPGSLFPALHRLTEKGMIEGRWSESESKRRVKIYTLTASGREQLASEKRTWKKIFTAMNRVLAEEN